MKHPALTNLITYDPNPLLTTVAEHLNVKSDAQLARARDFSPYYQQNPASQDGSWAQLADPYA